MEDMDYSVHLKINPAGTKGVKLENKSFFF